MSARVDAVAARVQTAVTTRQVTQSMGGVVKAMEGAMRSMNLEKVYECYRITVVAMLSTLQIFLNSVTVNFFFVDSTAIVEIGFCSWNLLLIKFLLYGVFINVLLYLDFTADGPI